MPTPVVAPSPKPIGQADWIAARDADITNLIAIFAKQATESAADADRANAETMAGMLVPMMVAKQIECAKLDSSLSAHFGVIGEILKRAHDTVGAVLVSDYFGGKTVTPWKSTSKCNVSDYVASVEAHLEETVAFIKSQESAWLLINSPKSDLIDGLRVQRSKLVGEYVALLNTAGQFAGLVIPFGLATLPDEPRQKGAKSSTGRTKNTSKDKSKFVQYYRMIDGNRADFTGAGNSLSQIAFQHFGNPGVQALRTALASAGAVDETVSTDAVSVTLNNKTHVIGWEVRPASADESADDESTDEDESTESTDESDKSGE